MAGSAMLPDAVLRFAAKPQVVGLGTDIPFPGWMDQ